MNIKITSIGKACSECQQMPDAIRAAAEELGVKPAATIDGKVYFDTSDVTAIGELLHQSGRHLGQGPQVHC